jgi:glutamate decarboxylase
MGVNVQVCWEKFCTFWEVEPRQVPMEGERFHLDPQAAADLCAALDALQERTGLDIPVHVDGASGGMVAPFLDEDLVWDFRLPRVASINTSGHKYGLVYPGVGWALWRDAEALPEELVFRVNYLGGDMPTFALNFSRPGAQVVAQYYTFLRLGREGYRAVQQSTRDVARSVADRVAALGDFRLLTRGDELPVFAFTTAEDVTAYDVFDVSRRLRERGWLVPAYTFPANREDLSVLRVVCRNGFSADLADLFVEDLTRLLPELRRQPGPLTRDRAAATGFHH